MQTKKHFLKSKLKIEDPSNRFTKITGHFMTFDESDKEYVIPKEVVQHMVGEVALPLTLEHNPSKVIGDIYEITMDDKVASFKGRIHTNDSGNAIKQRLMQNPDAYGISMTLNDVMDLPRADGKRLMTKARALTEITLTRNPGNEATSFILRSNPLPKYKVSFDEKFDEKGALERWTEYTKYDGTFNPEYNSGFLYSDSVDAPQILITDVIENEPVISEHAFISAIQDMRGLKRLKHNVEHVKFDNIEMQKAFDDKIEGIYKHINNSRKDSQMDDLPSISSHDILGIGITKPYHLEEILRKSTKLSSADAKFIYNKFEKIFLDNAKNIVDKENADSQTVQNTSNSVADTVSQETINASIETQNNFNPELVLSLLQNKLKTI
jgi:hypothetical protein